MLHSFHLISLHSLGYHSPSAIPHTTALLIVLAHFPPELLLVLTLLDRLALPEAGVVDEGPLGLVPDHVPEEVVDLAPAEARPGHYDVAAGEVAGELAEGPVAAM